MQEPNFNQKYCLKTLYGVVGVMYKKISSGLLFNTGTISFANTQEYWSTKHKSRVSFYFDIFTRFQFNQIFSLLHLKHQNAAPRALKTRIKKLVIFRNTSVKNLFNILY